MKLDELSILETDRLNVFLTFGASLVMLVSEAPLLYDIPAGISCSSTGLWFQFSILYMQRCVWGQRVTHIHKGTAMETKASCTPDMHSRTLNFFPVTLIDFYVQVIFVAPTVFWCRMSGAERGQDKARRRDGVLKEWRAGARNSDLSASFAPEVACYSNGHKVHFSNWLMADLGIPVFKN